VPPSHLRAIAGVDKLSRGEEGQFADHLGREVPRVACHERACESPCTLDKRGVVCIRKSSDEIRRRNLCVCGQRPNPPEHNCNFMSWKFELRTGQHVFVL